MRKIPNYKVAIYLMITGTILATCSAIKMPIVTIDSMERSIVTQICDGDSQSSPYSWLLLMICLSNFVFAFYLIFPNEMDELINIVINYIQVQEQQGQEFLYPTNSIDYQNQNIDTIKQLEVKQDSQPGVSFNENPSLIQILQEELPEDIPDEWFKIIYLSLLKQEQKPGSKLLFVNEVIDYFLNINIEATSEKITERFMQLESFGYGKCENSEYGLGFVVEGISNG